MTDLATRLPGTARTALACDDPDAMFKVVDRVAGKTETGASACLDFDGVEQTYCRGAAGERGFVRCLAPVFP